MPHPLDYNLIIFDVDGTLRRCLIPEQPCPNKPGEWELLPNVKETLALYEHTRTGFGFASNQGGVGLGFLDYATASQMIIDTIREAAPFLRTPFLLEICPHEPKAGCVCRKPSPAMINWIVMANGPVYLAGSSDPLEAKVLYVGDMDSDRVCAENARVDFMWARDFF